MAVRDLEVEADEAGIRADRWLVQRVPELSRDRAQRLFAEGAVRVGGRRVRKSHRLEAGDRVTLDAAPLAADFDALANPALELSVLLENEDYVIVDKPAGIPSHPLRPDETETLAGALVARYPEMRGVGYRAREPGILHRLDTHTSGVMLAARNQQTFERLRVALQSGAIEKHYLARCSGVVSAPAIIETPIAHDPKRDARMCVCLDARQAKRLAARHARTEVVRSRAAPHGSIVEVRADRAHRHQIRVHLASIGHPLLGDVLYGGPRLQAPDHHLLHASSIRVDGRLVLARPWNHEASEPELA